MSVAPSGAVSLNAASGPTAHAVGYYLPPLRGSGSPRALGQRPWRLRPGLLNAAPDGAPKNRGHEAGFLNELPDAARHFLISSF